MKVLGVILACMVALATCEIKEEENVLVLTTDNFDEAISANAFVLVEFYDDDCIHCERMAPEYKKLGEKLKEEESPIKLAKCNIVENSAIGAIYNITSLPTLKLFRKELEGLIEPVKYIGHRFAHLLKFWLEKKTGRPPSIEAKSVDDINKNIAKYDVIGVGFFKEVKSNAYKSFMKMADDAEFIMMHTHDEKLFDYYKIKDDDALIVLKNYDYGRDDFYNDFSVIEMKDFIEFSSLRVVVDFAMTNYQYIHDQKTLEQHIFLFTNYTSPDFEKIKAGFETIAYKYRGRYLFVIVDTEMLSYVDMYRYFTVDTDDQNTLRFVDMSTDDMVKYYYDETDFSPIGITNFIRGVELGLIPRFLRSEVLPEDWEEQPVKVLTTENFYDVTQDETKLVLVEFYSPMCYNCKILHPYFEELAEHYKDQPDVWIAKTNGFLNEYADYHYNEFPVILIFPKGGVQPIKYTSDALDIDEYINWIDHQGKPPTKKWVTQEEIDGRREAVLEKIKEIEAEAAAKKDKEEL